MYSSTSFSLLYPTSLLAPILYPTHEDRIGRANYECRIALIYRLGRHHSTLAATPRFLELDTLRFGVPAPLYLASFRLRSEIHRDLAREPAATPRFPDFDISSLGVASTEISVQPWPLLGSAGVNYGNSASPQAIYLVRQAAAPHFPEFDALCLGVPGITHWHTYENSHPPAGTTEEYPATSIGGRSNIKFGTGSLSAAASSTLVIAVLQHPGPYSVHSHSQRLATRLPSALRRQHRSHPDVATDKVVIS
ncbi:hypothetical protein DFP72DRAFT_852500 [Ephemerocybe angulata]|uniref:Uncharacterized protein n=1 Tax=Ephemerocybe angulata TaxID=980116 RepID=A0A8H6HLR0_9AGAR|nr:hypothetical protein DFP72DRAFT_852498 [Tulosesus angulatus]KAF6749349.1 hypothetical protein DFP72DRAFT_852500 [Tulosesus angulatus]